MGGEMLKIFKYTSAMFISDIEQNPRRNTGYLRGQPINGWYQGSFNTIQDLDGIILGL